jgi:predicted nuclease of predicted toxin-antitoxin system
MRVKLDENLPLLLASALKGLGHDVHTTNEEGLAGCLDGQIWEAAQREGRFLLTQDHDFSDARRFVPGTHCGISADPSPFAEPTQPDGSHNSDF